MSAMASSTPRPVTPASPKVPCLKARERGVPYYGCEHLQRLFTNSQDSTVTTLKYYKMLLRIIFDKTPIIPQTSKTADGLPVTSLTTNYLCLQCSATATEKNRRKHGEAKSHMFYVHSRNGSLFCQMCGDFVWDPTLEDLRVRREYVYGSVHRVALVFTPTNESGRKRKHDELFTEDMGEDPKYISSNTSETPCRARGIRGIYNMGATCFMSVILQSFIHNPLLRNFYLSDGHRSGYCVRRDCLSCDMDDMFQDFYAQDSTLSFSASNILASSWSSKQAAFATLAGYDEQDAHEYFQFLVEELHRTNKSIDKNQVDEASSPPHPDSAHGHICDCIVHQTFYGKLQSTVTCQSCGRMTTSVEPFLDLSLGLDNISRTNGSRSASKTISSLTLQKCLDEEYMWPERCEYTCHNCDETQEAKKQLSIKRLPNVLCIQFKRFEHIKDVAQTSKINSKVQFPLQINMLPYTNRAKSQNSDENFELARSCTYDLLSVVVHVGSLDTGHYVSYSRVGDQWFMFDDHRVTLAMESQVLGAEAFLLFYIVRSLA